MPHRLIGLAALAALGFASAAILLPHSPGGLRELLLSAGPAAPAIAIAAWMVLTPACFPGTVMAAAGGLAFGAAGGAAVALAGAVAGGLTAFFIARTGARGSIEQLLAGRPRLSRVGELLERRGFTAVLAARLTPGVPASGLHFVAGASPVAMPAFAGAIAVGALLRTVPYALLGNGLASGSLATVVIAAASIVLGGAAAAILVRRVWRPLPMPASA